jgi:hypothetical protein
MSLLKSNSVQIGQSATATNNFTLSVPSSPDGTIKLARGNSGATTQDILSVNASGAVTLTNGGAITLAAAQATTSGTAIDFTSIPSWAKRVTVMFSGVSTNGASRVQIQLGTSSGFETSGYLGSIQTATAALNSNFSAGFLTTDNASGTATYVRHGLICISALGSNAWVASINMGLSNQGDTWCGAGSKTLSSTLDRVRITTVNGTDTFDAGTINIMYEG